MQYLKLVMMYSCCNIDLHSPRIGVHLFLRKLPLLTCAVMILSFLPITSIPDFPASLSAPPPVFGLFLSNTVFHTVPKITLVLLFASAFKFALNHFPFFLPGLCLICNTGAIFFPFVFKFTYSLIFSIFSKFAWNLCSFLFFFIIY